MRSQITNNLFSMNSKVKVIAGNAFGTETRSRLWTRVDNSALKGQSRAVLPIMSNKWLIEASLESDETCIRMPAMINGLFGQIIEKLKIAVSQCLT